MGLYRPAPLPTKAPTWIPGAATPGTSPPTVARALVVERREAIPAAPLQRWIPGVFVATPTLPPIQRVQPLEVPRPIAPPRASWAPGLFVATPTLPPVQRATIPEASPPVPPLARPWVPSLQAAAPPTTSLPPVQPARLEAPREVASAPLQRWLATLAAALPFPPVQRPAALERREELPPRASSYLPTLAPVALPPVPLVQARPALHRIVDWVRRLAPWIPGLAGPVAPTTAVARYVIEVTAARQTVVVPAQPSVIKVPPGRDDVEVP